MPGKRFHVTEVKPSELKRLTDIVSSALIVPPRERKDVHKVIKGRGIENLRAVRFGKEIVGGLLIYHWGHFFGGKSVRAAGIAYVGVAPEYRRVGAASVLMADTVLELYGEGIPLSTLYPANDPLYRKSGYERAMDHAIIEVKLADINVRNMKLDVVRHKGKSLKVLKDVYRQFASMTNGNVDRNEIEWGRMVKPWSLKETNIYLFKRGREVEGYAVMWLREKDNILIVHDFALLSRDAAERLLTLLGDHSSIIEKARFAGSTTEPILQLLPPRSFEFRRHPYCMLRIVSVPGALRARGYPIGVEAELHFDVDDDVIRQNNGRFVLKVRNGKGTVKKGGEGTIRVDIRTLAQLYTGFMSPSELRLAGKLETSDEDLARMLPVFAGPRPWIRDDF